MKKSSDRFYSLWLHKTFRDNCRCLRYVKIPPDIDDFRYVGIYRGRANCLKKLKRYCQKFEVEKAISERIE